MDLRTRALVGLSRRLLRPPSEHTIDYKAYSLWRENSLASSWRNFSDTEVEGKDVLDFGCGDGALSLYLAANKGPRQVIGVDLNPLAIERATNSISAAQLPRQVSVEFRPGSVAGLPVADESIDIIVAFDCLEHVMSPLPILKDWFRVLRPGGLCLIEWFPYKGPWGPHMESLIPVPWAHILFGQRTMFRAAEAIYDSAYFTPRHWDLDDAGKKKPNKWKAWFSFKEQGYINELDLNGFRGMAERSGLQVVRLDKRSFGGSGVRKLVGRTLLNTPFVGEYFLSFAVIELMRPSHRCETPPRPGTR